MTNHGNRSASPLINYIVGDATEPEGSGVKIIVHCCNDRGKWGAGFVMALSRKWEDPQLEYLEMARGGLSLGDVQFVRVEPKIIVANLVGQRGVRGPDNPVPVRYGAISVGMRVVANKARMYKASIHMPRMGCGLAGGSWDKIASILNETVGALSVTVYDLP